MFARLKNWYQELAEENRYSYRLLEVIDKNGEKLVHIGLRNSYYTFKQPLNASIWDDKLLLGLSPQDIRSLSMYAVFSYMQPKYELLNVEYIDDEHACFSLRDKITKEEFTLSDEELNSSSDIWSKLNNSHAYKVGFLCGDNKHRKK